MTTNADAPATELSASLTVTVEVQTGQSQGQRSFFDNVKRITLGRGDDVDVRLLDQQVQPIHAELEQSSNHYVLRTMDARSELSLREQAKKIASLELPINTIADVLFGRQGPCCKILIGNTYAFGRFLLIGELGAGGMSKVYLARRLGPHNLVYGDIVLKVIHAEFSHKEEFVARLLDEAKILAELHHENCVQIHEVGEIHGTLFIAMEYLRGVSFLSLLKRAKQIGHKIDFNVAAALAAQVCRGLHAAHEFRRPGSSLRNIVHRDIKHANLMLLPSGQVKVIDFGIAYAEGSLFSREDPRAFRGTVDYSSPEQLQPWADPSVRRILDGRSDVFSVGVVLYELLTARPLFGRETQMLTVLAIRGGEVPPLREQRADIPPVLADVIHSALAVDPAQRPKTAAKFAEQLEAIVQAHDSRYLQRHQIASYFNEHGVPLSGVTARSLLGPPPFAQTQIAPTQPLPSPAPPGSVKPIPPPPATKPPPLPPSVPPASPAPVKAPAPPPAPPIDSRPVAPLTTIRLPMPGTETTWVHVCPGLMLRVVQLTLHRVQVPQPLPFAEMDELHLPPLHLPPLQVFAKSDQRRAQIITLAETTIMGKSKAGIFLDIQDRESRVPEYEINQTIDLAKFDVGYRAPQFRTCFIASRYNDSGNEPDLSVQVPHKDVQLLSPKGAQRLTAVLTQTENMSFLLAILSMPG